MTYQFKSIRSAGGESTFALGGILLLELVCRESLVLRDLDLLGFDCCVGDGLDERGGAQPGSHAGGLEKRGGGFGRMNLRLADW